MFKILSSIDFRNVLYITQTFRTNVIGRSLSQPAPNELDYAEIGRQYTESPYPVASNVNGFDKEI